MRLSYRQTGKNVQGISWIVVPISEILLMYSRTRIRK